MKKCTDCGENKIFDKFYIKRTMPDGKRHYQSYCKDCANRRSLERYREKHPPKERRSPEEIREQKNARRRERRKDAEVKRKEAAYREANADRIKQVNADYREQHREQIVEQGRNRRVEDPEAYRRYVQKWKSENKPAIHIGTINQRARQLNAPGKLTVADWNRQKASQKFTCLMCKRKEPDIKLEVDHIRPMIDGGSNTVDNIQGLCHSCNSKKHRQVIDLRQEEIE